MEEPRGEPHPSLFARKIVHLDMDAFYAQVEVRDRPELRGKPVVVGGSPKSRGVVCTASYEARRFGIGSAMSCAEAYRRCPQAVFVRPRMQAYQEVSQLIRAEFLAVTPLVEPLSLDEAYLDVTENALGKPATAVAHHLKARIREVTGGLTGSAGVAPNKLVAKIASDLRKPDGLFVVRPRQVAAFMEVLPVGRIHGVGKVTRARLEALGVITCADAQRLSLRELVTHFGKYGAALHDRVRGIDPRPVVATRAPRSIGHEDTFAEDTSDLEFMRTFLRDSAVRLATRLEKRDLRARTVVVKVRYHGFVTVTRSQTLLSYTRSAERIGDAAVSLLARTEAGRRPVRLLGVTTTNFDRDPRKGVEPGQRLLFEL